VKNYINNNFVPQPGVQGIDRAALGFFRRELSAAMSSDKQLPMMQSMGRAPPQNYYRTAKPAL
jgi:hypothetical protein